MIQINIEWVYVVIVIVFLSALLWFLFRQLVPMVQKVNRLLDESEKMLKETRSEILPLLSHSESIASKTDEVLENVSGLTQKFSKWIEKIPASPKKAFDAAQTVAEEVIKPLSQVGGIVQGVRAAASAYFSSKSEH